MHKPNILTGAFFLLAQVHFSAAEEPMFGTFTVDVVGLVRDHQEVSGSAALTANRFGYVYLFSQETNREAFLKDPEKYEVQLGGACGKMGELSGRGSTDR